MPRHLFVQARGAAKPNIGWFDITNNTSTARVLTQAEVLLLNKFWEKFEMKYCGMCCRTKEFSDFHKRGNRLQGRCWECVAAYNAAYRAANPEKIAAQKAAYNTANRAKIAAQQSAYRAANQEKIAAKNAAARLGGRDPEKPWPPGDPGYRGAHGRVDAVYGLAKLLDCVVCEAPAASWSYNAEDPDEYSTEQLDNRNGSSRTMFYSANPAFYDPLCHSCHTALDKRVAARRADNRGAAARALGFWQEEMVP